jgi:CRP/FNR family transcriptional regulator, cyclic AMP receptor protein
MSVSPDALRTVPLLTPLDDKQLKRLAGDFKERRVEAGGEIMSAGRGGVAFFILLEGEASVTVDGQERRRLKAGDYVGEIAMIDPDAPRSATVTAITDVRLAHLSAWDFRPFVVENPEVAWDLLRTLAKRLREAEQRAAGG